MSQSEVSLEKSLLENAINWFRPQFRQTLVTAIESEFPNYPLPREVQEIVRSSNGLLGDVQGFPTGPLSFPDLWAHLSQSDPTHRRLFKQITYSYRRECAARAEHLTEKTFHLELTGTLQQEVKTLDALVNEEWFQQIEPLRLPRLKDFLPVQFIEAAMGNLITVPSRQYDEKFHILQAPALFLPDIGYFRAKCEVRDAPLTVAFLDIDDFKRFNTAHGETKVDRNLLPRFMQTMEAHVFHHGYAYRHGGDEYLILLPSLSKSLAIEFLDELRSKLAALAYPEIDSRTTVSIGACTPEPDCPLTDRELRVSANDAKKFAKDHGKDCIATFKGPRFVAQELHVVPARHTGTA